MASKRAHPKEGPKSTLSNDSLVRTRGGFGAERSLGISIPLVSLCTKSPWPYGRSRSHPEHTCLQAQASPDTHFHASASRCWEPHPGHPLAYNYTSHEAKRPQRGNGTRILLEAFPLSFLLPSSGPGLLPGSVNQGGGGLFISLLLPLLYVA